MAKSHNLKNNSSSKSETVTIFKRPLAVVDGAGEDLDMLSGHLVEKFFQLSKKIDGKCVPPSACHAYIVAYGKLYQYSGDGLSISLYEEQPLEEEIQTFTTSRTQEEFEGWLRSDKVRTEFRTDNYEEFTHNCLLFVKDGVHYLGGDFPPILQKLMDWCERGGQKSLDNLGFRWATRTGVSIIVVVGAACWYFIPHLAGWMGNVVGVATDAVNRMGGK